MGAQQMTKKSLIPIIREDRQLSIELTKIDAELKQLNQNITDAMERKSRYLERSIESDEKFSLEEWLRKLKEAGMSEENLENEAEFFSEIRNKVLKQKKLERLKRQKQSEYKFEHEFRELYSISDIPEGEWFGLDKHGNPASNAKNIALALKRLPLCEIMFDELGNCSIKYSNYPIRLQNAPIFFSHKIRDAFKFIPKREQFSKALNLLRD
jgi:phosphoenolpyruvate carboxylase